MITVFTAIILPYSKLKLPSIVILDDNNDNHYQVRNGGALELLTLCASCFWLCVGAITMMMMMMMMMMMTLRIVHQLCHHESIAQTCICCQVICGWGLFSETTQHCDSTA